MFSSIDIFHPFEIIDRQFFVPNPESRYPGDLDIPVISPTDGCRGWMPMDGCRWMTVATTHEDARVEEEAHRSANVK
jgi:hypothetical protein